MNKLKIKQKLIEARNLLSEAAEGISALCAARTCLAEEDLVVLEGANFQALRIAETNDSLLFRYSRERFGKDVFAPKEGRAKVVQGNRVKDSVC